MTVELSVVATVFALVFLVELPDKTMIATLVLSARYRPLPVLAGCAAAFAAQMAAAVVVGKALSLLPRPFTLGVVAALFAVGAVLLLRASFTGEEATPDSTPAATSAARIALITFGVLVIAEFGDGSQLATAALAARYAAPVSVFLGAWFAELAVCTIAVLAGRALLRTLPIRLIQRIAAGVFAVFSLVAVAEIVPA